MHSFARRTARALVGLAVAAGLALTAAPPGRAASTGEGETVKPLFSEKLPTAVSLRSACTGGTGNPLCPMRQDLIQNQNRVPPSWATPQS